MAGNLSAPEAWEIEIGKRLWEARTPGEVEEIIKESEKRWGIKTIPVGRPNNIGTIRMASDTGLAMVERITNAIDAIIELKALLNPSAKPTTPEEAAQILLGVPKGGLTDLTDTERRKLAENIVVGMHESGNSQRPTIVITDKGVGQHPSDFDSTLLSLNESNKMGKPFTMGVYGQGGSTPIGFSSFTVIVSRRHPGCLRAGQTDEVGFTVVFEDVGDPTKQKLPQFVWLVKKDGTPLTLPPACFPELDYGSRFAHIEYDAQRLRSAFTTQMWQFLHATLIDPVLPFILTGDRSASERKAKDRVIIGNQTRLDNIDKAKGDIELAANDQHKVDLGPKYGTVEVEWWALQRPAGSTSKSAPAEGYVQADNAIALLLHGQRMDALPRTWIKDRAQLPHLYKNMVVHISANGLTAIGRRELFASTRERATDSDLKTKIYAEVESLIRSDEDLKRLNHEERERLLRKSATAANDKIKKRLGKFIKTKLRGSVKAGSKGPGTGTGGVGSGAGSGSGNQSGTGSGNPSGGGGGGGGRNTDDSHLPNVPTKLAFGSMKARVAQGFKSYVWVELDAKNGYLPAHEDDLTDEIEIVGGGDQNDPRPFVKSKSKLAGGKARWAIEAPADAATDKTYELQVKLMTANGLLEAMLPIEVVEPPKPNTGGKGGSEEDTGPNVQWVNRDQWDDHDGNLGPNIVGYVTESDEATDIWVNRHYTDLAAALSKKGLSGDAIHTRAERYQFPVACGMWLQHHELKTADPKPTEKYQREELRRLAEAVLVAIDPDVDVADAEAED